MKHSWAVRSGEKELMDDPGADENRLLATVEQFGAINRLVSRSRTLISRYILDDAARRGLVEYTVLDLGAGGCDIAEWLVDAAKRRGLAGQDLEEGVSTRLLVYCATLNRRPR